MVIDALSFRPRTPRFPQLSVRGAQLHQIPTCSSFFPHSSCHPFPIPSHLRSVAAVMADRQVTQQTVLSHIAKLDDPDADLRYMSLNDLYTILTGPSSSFLSGDNRCSNKLAEGLLKALDDQHGDVQNQALKWYATIASVKHSRIGGLLMTILVSVLSLFDFPSSRLSPSLKN